MNSLFSGQSYQSPRGFARTVNDWRKQVSEANLVSETKLTEQGESMSEGVIKFYVDITIS
jgi:hypothetical protein